MKNIRKYMTLLLAFVLVAGTVFAVQPVRADAASGPLKLDQKTYWKGEESSSVVPIAPTDSGSRKLIKKAKLVSVKSSNTKVLTVKKDGSSMTDCYVTPLRVGSSKITLKYKVKGKTYTTSRTYTVKKYPAPYSQIKVNDKKVIKILHKFSYAVGNYKENSAKIQITPKKGWKVISAYDTLLNKETGKEKTKDIKATSIKRGATVKINKGYDCYVFVTLQKTSTGETIEYAVRFFR